MQAIPPPHIGNTIKALITKHRISLSALAREMDVSFKTIQAYTKSSSMSVHRLFELSQAMGYNFFIEIAARLPNELPPKTEAPATTTIAQLNQQIAAMEVEVKTLKEVLRLVGGR